MIHMLYTFETNVLCKSKWIIFQPSIFRDMSDDSYPSISMFISFQPLDRSPWRCLVVRKRWKVVRPSDIWVRAIVPCAGRIPSSTTLKRRLTGGWPAWFALKKVLENEQNLWVFLVFDNVGECPSGSPHITFWWILCVFFCFNKQKKTGPTCLLKTQVETYSAELALRILYMCLGMPPFWNFPRWETRYNHPLRWMVEIGDWTNFQPFQFR